MIWTLPCAIMSAIFVATAFMLQLIGVAPEVVANLSSLNKIFSSLIPNYCDELLGLYIER